MRRKTGGFTVMIRVECLTFQSRQRTAIRIPYAGRQQKSDQDLLSEISRPKLTLLPSLQWGWINRQPVFLSCCGTKLGRSSFKMRYLCQRRTACCWSTAPPRPTSCRSVCWRSRMSPDSSLWWLQNKKREENQCLLWFYFFTLCLFSTRINDWVIFIYFISNIILISIWNSHNNICNICTPDFTEV